MATDEMDEDDGSCEEYARTREDRITIDYSRCQGCGSCVTACPNGGFRVVNGKSQLVNENFCDGLGYCIQNCPMGAIKFNGEVLQDTDQFCNEAPYAQNWPIKLPLVNPRHRQFKNADIAVVADCAPVVLRNFKKLFEGKVVLILCPKLGSVKELREKLTAIINQNNVKSIVSYNVDYICCESLPRLVKDAIRFSNKKDKLMPEYKNNVICLFGITKSPTCSL